MQGRYADWFIAWHYTRLVSVNSIMEPSNSSRAAASAFDEWRWYRVHVNAHNTAPALEQCDVAVGDRVPRAHQPSDRPSHLAAVNNSFRCRHRVTHRTAPSGRMSQNKQQSILLASSLFRRKPFPRISAFTSMHKKLLAVESSCSTTGLVFNLVSVVQFTY
jgi:hypothetical protein